MEAKASVLGLVSKNNLINQSQINKLPFAHSGTKIYGYGDPISNLKHHMYHPQKPPSRKHYSQDKEIWDQYVNQAYKLKKQLNDLNKLNARELKNHEKVRQKAQQTHKQNLKSSQKDRKNWLPIQDVLQQNKKEQAQTLKQLIYDRIFNNVNLTSSSLDNVIDEILEIREDLLLIAADSFLTNGFFYSAIKTLHRNPRQLFKILEDVRSCVGERENRVSFDSVGNWVWDEADRDLFLKQFSKLSVVKQFSTVKDQLQQLGYHGLIALASIEKEILIKVINDFQDQITPQLSQEFKMSPQQLQYKNFEYLQKANKNKISSKQKSDSKLGPEKSKDQFFTKDKPKKMTRNQVMKIYFQGQEQSQFSKSQLIEEAEPVRKMVDSVTQTNPSRAIQVFIDNVEKQSQTYSRKKLEKDSQAQPSLQTEGSQTMEQKVEKPRPSEKPVLVQPPPKQVRQSFTQTIEFVDKEKVEQAKQIQELQSLLENAQKGIIDTERSFKYVKSVDQFQDINEQLDGLKSRVYVLLNNKIEDISLPDENELLLQQASNFVESIRQGQNQIEEFLEKRSQEQSQYMDDFESDYEYRQIGDQQKSDLAKLLMELCLSVNQIGQRHHENQEFKNDMDYPQWMGILMSQQRDENKHKDSSASEQEIKQTHLDQDDKQPQVVNQSIQDILQNYPEETGKHLEEILDEISYIKQKSSESKSLHQLSESTRSSEGQQDKSLEPQENVIFKYYVEGIDNEYLVVKMVPQRNLDEIIQDTLVNKIMDDVTRLYNTNIQQQIQQGSPIQPVKQKVSKTQKQKSSRSGSMSSRDSVKSTKSDAGTSMQLGVKVGDVADIISKNLQDTIQKTEDIATSYQDIKNVVTQQVANNIPEIQKSGYLLPSNIQQILEGSMHRMTEPPQSSQEILQTSTEDLAKLKIHVNVPKSDDMQNTLDRTVGRIVDNLQSSLAEQQETQRAIPGSDILDFVKQPKDPQIDNSEDVKTASSKESRQFAQRSQDTSLGESTFAVYIEDLIDKLSTSIQQSLEFPTSISGYDSMSSSEEQASKISQLQNSIKQTVKETTTNFFNSYPSSSTTNLSLSTCLHSIIQSVIQKICSTIQDDSSLQEGTQSTQDIQANINDSENYTKSQQSVNQAQGTLSKEPSYTLSSSTHFQNALQKSLQQFNLDPEKYQGGNQSEKNGSSIDEVVSEVISAIITYGSQVTDANDKQQIQDQDFSSIVDQALSNLQKDTSVSALHEQQQEEKPKSHTDLSSQNERAQNNLVSLQNFIQQEKQLQSEEEASIISHDFLKNVIEQMQTNLENSLINDIDTNVNEESEESVQLTSVVQQAIQSILPSTVSEITQTYSSSDQIITTIIDETIKQLGEVPQVLQPIAKEQQQPIQQVKLQDSQTKQSQEKDKLKAVVQELVEQDVQQSLGECQNDIAQLKNRLNQKYLDTLPEGSSVPQVQAQIKEQSLEIEISNKDISDIVHDVIASVQQTQSQESAVSTDQISAAVEEVVEAVMRQYQGLVVTESQISVSDSSTSKGGLQQPLQNQVQDIEQEAQKILKDKISQKLAKRFKTVDFDKLVHNAIDQLPAQALQGQGYKKLAGVVVRQLESYLNDVISDDSSSGDLKEDQSQQLRDLVQMKNQLSTEGSDSDINKVVNGIMVGIDSKRSSSKGSKSSLSQEMQRNPVTVCRKIITNLNLLQSDLKDNLSVLRNNRQQSFRSISSARSEKSDNSQDVIMQGLLQAQKFTALGNLSTLIQMLKYKLQDMDDDQQQLDKNYPHVLETIPEKEQAFDDININKENSDLNGTNQVSSLSLGESSLNSLVSNVLDKMIEGQISPLSKQQSASSNQPSFEDMPGAPTQHKQGRAKALSELSYPSSEISLQNNDNNNKFGDQNLQETVNEIVSKAQDQIQNSSQIDLDRVATPLGQENISSNQQNIQPQISQQQQSEQLQPNSSGNPQGQQQVQQNIDNGKKHPILDIDLQQPEIARRDLKTPNLLGDQTKFSNPGLENFPSQQEPQILVLDDHDTQSNQDDSSPKQQHVQDDLYTVQQLGQEVLASLPKILDIDQDLEPRQVETPQVPDPKVPKQGEASPSNGNESNVDEQQRPFTSRTSFSSIIEPTQTEVESYAQYLGMNLSKDQEFFHIARQAIQAPLPPNWTGHLDSRGNEFFLNEIDQVSQYIHPLDPYFRDMYIQAKEKNELSQEPQEQ